MKVSLIKGEEVDRNKWNSCVHFAHNGNIFGYQWYLNNVVKRWDALVEGEYESVMPLIYTEKSFLKSSKLYTHPLLRSTGLYSVHVLSEKRIAAFLDAIPKSYKRWQLDLNEGVKIPRDYSSFKQKKKENAVLFLGDPYEKISEQYSPTLTQTLERANLAEVFSVNNLKPEQIANFYKEHAGSYYDEAHYHAFLRIMHNAQHRGWGISTGVKNRKGDLLAVNFYTLSHHRLMRVIAAESPQGKSVGALSFLVDQAVRINAGKQLFLDFNTENVGAFEQQFDVMPSPYFELSK